jgi:hypothetical protein
MHRAALPKSRTQPGGTPMQHYDARADALTRPSLYGSRRMPSGARSSAAAALWSASH